MNLIRKITVLSVGGNVVFEIGQEYCGFEITSIENYGGVYEVNHRSDKGNGTLATLVNCPVIVEYKHDW